jgi:hypothetical protein
MKMGGTMSAHSVPRRALQVTLGFTIFAWLGAVQAADLNPKAISIQIPKDIKWIEGNGSAHVNLVGDPEKPGFYIYLTKWYPHHNSRPHFHPNDRFITVLSGTWWVATGPKYDPEHMVPLPAGSFVTHYGKEIHYDGAKDGECVLEMVGMGPATSTPAEEK